MPLAARLTVSNLRHALSARATFSYNTAELNAPFTGVAGRTYSLYSVATLRNGGEI